MDEQPNHLMYHFLASGYDQNPWNNPYLDNAKSAIDAQPPVAALIPPDSTSIAAAAGTEAQPASIYCPQPVKFEPVQSYADTGGYNITPLGATGPSDPHNIYATAASNHPPDPQQMSALNFFAGAAAGSQVVGGYPATPAALMPLLGGGDQDSEQLKQQKELIYGHPLFPVLTLLFQKCELATCTPREPARDGDQVDVMNVCSAASFNEDLADFARTVQMNKPYYVPNPELDSLMINAIQVLRYHLLELEKVHELCDNFCAKYVNKIKERTQMDVIAEQPPPSMDQIQQPPQHQQSTTPRSQPAQPSATMPSPVTSSSMDQMQHYGTPGPQQYAQIQQHLEQQPCSSNPQQLGFLDINGVVNSAMNTGISTMDQQQTLQQFYTHTQQQRQAAAQMIVENGHGQQQQGQKREISTPSGAKSAKRAKKSNIQQQHLDAQLNPSPDTTTARAESSGGSRSSTAAATGEEQPTMNGGNSVLLSTAQPNMQNSFDGLDETGGEDGLSLNGDSMGEERDSAGSESEHKPQFRGENGGSGNGQKRKVPKVFSKEAISKFRAWLFNNITHPYPAEEQKKQLAAETGLTILQVNNWFINARRRIVQPMIDSNNRAGRPVSVFKNRRRKSSGGAGTPSPVPEGQSPELVNGNAAVNGEDASPEDSAANNSSNSGGSNSSTAGGGTAGHLLGGTVQPAAAQSSLLNFSTPSAVSNPYQAAAAVAAAAVSSNPYAGFGSAFPFTTGMNGMSAAAAMMPAYGLNSMASGWPSMDLGQAHRGGLDGC